ncbi:MAG: hypothetical protein U1F43_34130 [Myxococcota bacterium]
MTIGRNPGWHLYVAPADGAGLHLGCSDYHASITASLPSGLDGGAYTLVIERLSDEHYARVAEAVSLTLYLYWRDSDTGFGDYLAQLVGLGADVPSGELDRFRVALLAPTEVVRIAAGVRYDATIRARERVHDALATTRLKRSLVATLPEKSLLAQAEAIAEAVDVPVSVYSSPTAADTSAGGGELEPGALALEALAGIARRLEERFNQRGRGMFLIRDGELHVGPGRPVPMGELYRLDAEAGLISSKRTGTTPKDPYFAVANPDSASEAPTRTSWELALHGRPDLKPGDVVVFVPAEIDQARTGSFYDDLAHIGGVVTSPVEDWTKAVTLYVSGVEHRLDRATFATTVVGVGVDGPDDFWDIHSHAPDKGKASRQPASQASKAADVAAEIKRVARLAAGRGAEVAEVRNVRASGDDDPPRLTADYLRGLAVGDGHAQRVRRIDLERKTPSTPAGIGYATPFAWGRYGLVLPRYPGMRVLLVHRDGEGDEAVDVGALWRAGKDIDDGPSEAKPGDWWLALPSDRPEDEALTADGADAVERPDEREASNDLIDAQGRRHIELKQLTIRVSSDSAPKVGTRPALDDEDAKAVTIEHVDGGSRIRMKADGSIEIIAKAGMTIKAGGDLAIEAKNVKVKLASGGNMDVEG